MEDDILTTPIGGEVTLGDGKTYKLSPFDINTQSDLEQAFGCSLSKLMKKLEEKEATNMRLFVYIMLRENHPKLTLRSLGRLMIPKVMPKVMETIVGIITKAVADME